MAETLPNNVDAEKSLIACLLLFPRDYISICISSKLSDKDFFSKAYSYIYKAILVLYNNNRLIDCVTVGDELMKAWQLEYIWGMEALYEISASLLSTNWFIEYLKVVKEKSALRKIIKMCETSRTKSMDQWDSEQILAALRLDFYNFLNNDVIDSWGCTLDEAYDTLLAAVESWWLKPLCSTGFKEIDDYVAWFTETAVWVVGARSSHGKTTLVLNFLMNAVNQWIKVCYFSIEQDRTEIVQKTTSMLCWIPSQAYKAWASEELAKAIRESKDKARALFKNFVVFDKITRYEHIRNEIYAQAWQWAKLFCVDHILLITWDKKSGNSARDIWDIVNGFKQIAQELWVCIILVSQFNRELDKRMDPTPKMTDFNGSSDIENIANVAIWTFRPEFFYKDDCSIEDKWILEVSILKNRWGMLPQIPLRLWCDMAVSQVWSNPEPSRPIPAEAIHEINYDDYEIWD